MSTHPAITLSDLAVHFPGPSKNKPVRALDGVNLSVAEGSFHAIVGESGCGKTTLARTIMGLQPMTRGTLSVMGRDLADWQKNRRELAKVMQFVFQNPLGALSARQSVKQSLEEPLLIHGIRSSTERMKKIKTLLDYVGLPATALERLPRSLSGGQRQRVAIARALALEPRILICDEPLSALDVSIQAQIVKLFVDLQKELGLTIVMISHDLAVVREMCTSVTVMYLGKVMEEGNTKTIFGNPGHPYTQALLSSVPSPDPHVEATRERIILQGDPPSPMAPPSGCRFHTRCSKTQEQCRLEEPILKLHRDTNQVACHLADH